MNVVLGKKNNIVKIIIFCLLFSITTATIFSNVVIPVDDVYAKEESDIDEEPGWFEEGILRAVARGTEGWLIMTSKLLGGVGVMLNKVVEMSIVKMANYTNHSAVTSSWAIIRDLLNIFFIFGLLYISIKTIISSWSSDTKRLLSRLIVAAILINFSFFFTSLLIDVSNVVSLNVYQQMSSEDDRDYGCYNRRTRSVTLSNCWLNQMQTNSIYKVDATEGGIFTDKDASKGDWKNFITLTLMGGFVMVFAAIVFFAITIALLARFISLIFILITSPVMFASWILPNFSDITKKWSSKLQSELIFAPVIFIFMYISYNMLGAVANYGDGSGFASAIKSTSSNINGPLGIFLNFIIIIGFLVGSLVAAKTVGNSVAGSGANFAGKWLGKAGNKVFGGAMRNSVGRLAQKGADNIKGTTRVSQRLKSGLNKVGNASFDARNSKTFQGVASKTGITVGQGQKGGFRDAQSSRVKRANERYENAGKLTPKEAAERDRLKLEINKKHELELKAKKLSEDKIKESKEELKVAAERYGKDSDEYQKIANDTKARMDVHYQTISNVTNAIKNDPNTDAIKKIDKGLEARQKNTLDALGKTTAKFNEFVSKTTRGRISNPVNSSTLQAARDIRTKNEKKAKQSDTDKIIQGVTKGVNKDDK